MWRISKVKKGIICTMAMIMGLSVLSAMNVMAATVPASSNNICTVTAADEKEVTVLVDRISESMPNNGFDEEFWASVSSMYSTCYYNDGEYQGILKYSTIKNVVRIDEGDYHRFRITIEYKGTVTKI